MSLTGSPATAPHAVAIDPILRMPAVEAATGIKKSTIYVKMAEGSFPACVRLSARAVGWRTSAVRAWLEAREGH